MEVLTRAEVLRGIVERTNLERFTERALDSFWERPDHQRLEPPRHEVRAWVRWNTDLVIRWLTEARPPSEAELERFRQRARDHAAAGTPPDIVPANFRRGARFAWRTMLEAATDEERPALIESADLLFEYVDRVSRIYSEVYEAAASCARNAAEEIGARVLLARIADDEVALPEDLQLAERIGFQIERSSRAFVLAAPGRAADYHAQLAAALRRRGALAASEGRRVVGLANAASVWRGLDVEERAVIAQSHVAIQGERGRTAAALPVHRNTLRDRINRISEITGVDLDTPAGRGLAWLAWLHRRDSPFGPTRGQVP